MPPDPSRRGHADIAPGPSKYEEVWCPLRRGGRPESADVHKPRVPRNVAGMRSGGEQHHPPRAACHGLQVSKRSESPQATWASSTTSRSQASGGSDSRTWRCFRKSGEAIQTPARRQGFSPNAPARPIVASAAAIGGDDGQGEARAKLVDPLIAQRRRHEQQDSRRRFTADKLRHDESGLNGLAQPHIVCEQQPGVAGDGREHGRELVRQHVEARRDRGHRQPQVRRARNQRGRACRRLLTARPRWTAPVGSEHGLIERREKRDAPISRGDVEPHDVPIAPCAFHAPAPLADPDFVTRERKDSVQVLPPPHASCCRNCNIRPGNPAISRARASSGAREMPSGKAGIDHVDEIIWTIDRGCRWLRQSTDRRAEM